LIPSTPKRTWLFLLSSSLAYFGPDLLTPAAWNHSYTYIVLSTCYQDVLIVAGFAFGTAICRALVAHEIASGPLRTAVDKAVLDIRNSEISVPQIILADHSMPFVFTAGLLPGKCEVFISSALVNRLSPTTGMRFLIARATAHTAWYQRSAAILPILAITTLVPDVPHEGTSWFELGVLLFLWLVSHWVFELAADHKAAGLIGKQSAADGLREIAAATASRVSWLKVSPPMYWRLRVANSA
jgi:hypothetical protein